MLEQQTANYNQYFFWYLFMHIRFEMVNEAKIINIHVYTRNKFC